MRSEYAAAAAVEITHFALCFLQFCSVLHGSWHPCFLAAKRALDEITSALLETHNKPVQTQRTGQQRINIFGDLHIFHVNVTAFHGLSLEGLLCIHGEFAHHRTCPGPLRCFGVFQPSICFPRFFCRVFARYFLSPQFYRVYQIFASIEKIRVLFCRPGIFVHKANKSEN